jgi:hypothetical protein
MCPFSGAESAFSLQVHPAILRLRVARHAKPIEAIVASRGHESHRQRFSPRVLCYSELFMREDIYKVIVERPRRENPADQISTREIKARRLR